MTYSGSCLTYAKRGLVVGRISNGVFVDGGTKVDTRNVNHERVYRSVRLASLGNRRRGRHHNLVGGIMRQLKSLNAGSALEIPLTDVGVELENLRSAVHRAAAAESVPIQTQSDEKNFYVWDTQNT
jgi:hypothetical protein